MTSDKYFDVVKVEWPVAESIPGATTIRFMTVVRTAGDVTFAKDGNQILRMPVRQWEELKRKI